MLVKRGPGRLFHESRFGDLPVGVTRLALHIGLFVLGGCLTWKPSGKDDEEAEEEQGMAAASLTVINIIFADRSLQFPQPVRTDSYLCFLLVVFCFLGKIIEFAGINIIIIF